MNWSADEVAEVLPAVVTVTFTVPGDSAGEMAVIEVVELTVVAVAVTVPNITVAEKVKLVPVMVTKVPPEAGPEVGDMAVIVGAGVDGVEVVVRITMSLEVSPSTSQKLAETHDTPLRPYTLEGRNWFVQVVPFHESATPRGLKLREKLPPTTSQEVAEMHDTPLRLPTFGGRVWFVQVVPFHESATPSEW